jgi:parallel beta-helix repeat protein
MIAIRRHLLSRRSVLGGALFIGTKALGHGVNDAPLNSARRDFYVSLSGNDDNPGNLEAPFHSIGRVFSAVSDLGANDRITVMPGVYSEQIVVTKGGDSSGYLTLRSQVPHAAQIKSPKNTYSAVNIVSSYVLFDGFDVTAGGSGHGIEATFINGNSSNNGPHHITITNNISHHNAGSGISMAYGDFYTIEGNICYSNCSSNRYQGSGISVYAARAVPGAADGLRNFIRRNICFDNLIIHLPGNPEPPHSDGNGIIIDDFANSQSGNSAGVYPFRTLVDDNIAYHNGGRGIHVYLSDNVTLLNNTSYHNNRDNLNPATWRGELSNLGANNAIWANNIGVANTDINPNNTAINEGPAERRESKNVVWRRNLTFNGRSGEMSLNVVHPNPTLTSKDPERNLFGVDPQFVGIDIRGAADLHLRANSSAIDAGTVAFGVSPVDLDEHPRIAGKAVDLGAFEFAPETKLE